MLRDNAPRAAATGPSLPLVPLALSAAALVAALLSMHVALPGLLVALALVLTAVACTVAGALWHRQKMVARVADARHQHQLLLQLTDAWVWQTDAEHRLVRWQPPQGAPASSWAAAASGGELLWDRFNDLSGAMTQRLQQQAGLPDTAVTQGADTQQRHWRLRGLPRFDRHGCFAGHMGVAHPEEHTPAAEQPPTPTSTTSSLAQMAEARRHAESLAAEHAGFTYTVSHDLRAPIRVVDGFGRILKEDYGQVLDRIGNDHLDRIIAAAARMGHMIDALLALSQLSAQPLMQQPVALSQVAQFVVDDLQRASPERAVRLRIQPGLIAQGDPTLLRVLLDNLLGNAWKYSAKRADAELGLEQVELAGRRVYVVFDNGAGFDMRFADRLFGAFQRLHSSSEFQGTGVGLASVKRIVRRHGGDIWAESEVGQGARFYFTLAADSVN